MMKAGMVCAVVLLCPVLVSAGSTIIVDADSFPVGVVLNEAFAQVVLTDMRDDPTVWSAESAAATTGTHVFGDATEDHDWDFQEFRASFNNPFVTQVSIDAIADGFEDYGRLEAYAADGTLLAYDATARLDSRGVEGLRFVTLNVASEWPIAYILAGADSALQADDIELDHLVFTSHVEIPVPRALLLAGVGASFVCGLRKCRCL